MSESHRKKVREDIKASLEKTQQPIRTEPPTNWAMRWIVGLIVGPTFIFSSAYFPRLFQLFALIMNTFALYEYDNFVEYTFQEDLEKHQISKFFLIGLGNILLLTSCITSNIIIILTVLQICFIALIFFNIFSAAITKQESFSHTSYSQLTSHFVGIFWISLGLCTIVLLSKEKPHLSFYLIGMTVLSDSSAMLIGRPFGKHKIYKTLSPKKSWEGIFGGVFVAALFFQFVFYLPFRKVWKIIPQYDSISLFILSCIIGIICQFGDLTQSYFKRVGSIKESGKFFPGHGGVLDRICSVLIVTQLLYYASDFIDEHCTVSGFD